MRQLQAPPPNWPQSSIPRPSFLAFHPGVAHYSREIGIKIPDDLTKAV
jgi:hypothetical protein